MTLEPSLSLSEIVRNAQQPKDLISEILKKIRKANDRDDILTAIVEITHQILRCDRVVIYSLQEKSQGKIVAESVTSGFTQTLNMVIKDSCFDAKYIGKYRQGRVRTINDIYKAGMSPCYIESLEEIEVKANAVIPLIELDKSLYGLLVAHQCSQTRQWQQSEISLMLQIANWGMAQMHRCKKEQQLTIQLARINKWQASLNEITKDIHAGADKTEILQLATNKAKDFLDCDRIIVYSLEKPHYGEIVAECAADSLASILGNVIKDPCFEYRYIDKYKKGRVRAIENIYEAGMSACYVENLAKIAVKSNLVVPIAWDNGEIYGLLVAHECFNYRKWRREEIDWLNQVAFQTGLALSKVKLKEKIQLMNSSSSIIETARDTITIAKSNIKKIQEPIRNTSHILKETNNLSRLLEREFKTINTTGSMQTKKEIKLIQIIFKKLFMQMVKTKNYFDLLEAKTKKIEELLEDGAVELYSQEENLE